MSPRRRPRGDVVGGWQRPSWATRTRTGVNCVIHDRDLARVPQPTEGVEKGHRLEVAAAVVDHLAGDADGSLVVTRAEPLIYLGPLGFTVGKARALAAMLTEVADTVETGMGMLPGSEADEDQADDELGEDDEPDDEPATATAAE